MPLGTLNVNPFSHPSCLWFPAASGGAGKDPGVDFPKKCLPALDRHFNGHPYAGFLSLSLRKPLGAVGCTGSPC